jgi:4-amino-4-deoxy-L-arabinose transferase-like glycosyltransferase
VAACVVLALRRRFDRGLQRFAAAVGDELADVLRTIANAVRAEHRVHLLAVGAAIGAGVGLRLQALNVPMRYDEATTFNNYASRPLYIGLSDYRTPNNHLFHTLLVHISTAIFGTAPWAVRLPALLAGILVLPAAYLVVRALWGRFAALGATVLVAASSTMVEYSANARGYTLIALFFLLMILVGLRLLDGGRPVGWVAITILAILCVYTTPPGILAAGAAGVWLLVSTRRLAPGEHRLFVTRFAMSSGATVVLAGLLYAPVIAASGLHAVTSNEFVAPKPIGAFLSSVPHGIHTTWSTWNRDLPQPFAWFLAAACLAGMARRTRAGSLGPLPVALAWSAAIITAQRAFPYARVWLFLVPLYLGTAAGFVVSLVPALPGRNLRWAAGIVATAGAIALVAAAATSGSIRASRDTGALLDGPHVATFLSTYLRPTDTILATGSDSILEYYLGRLGIDARSRLYAAQPGKRVVVVVNRLGGQTIQGLATPAYRAAARLTRPTLVARYPSATVYVLTRSPRAAGS